jgi:hypothetical protein
LSDSKLNEPIMTRLLTSIGFILLLSCANHEFRDDPMTITCKKCGKSSSDMQWMASLLENTKTNPSLFGDIYAVPLDGSIIIIHQPIIMSCFACVLYDCDGNRLEHGTLDLQKLLKGMNSANLVYSPRQD